MKVGCHHGNRIQGRELQRRGRSLSPRPQLQESPGPQSHGSKEKQRAVTSHSQMARCWHRVPPVANYLSNSGSFIQRKINTSLKVCYWYTCQTVFLFEQPRIGNVPQAPSTVPYTLRSVCSAMFSLLLRQVLVQETEMQRTLIGSFSESSLWSG